MKFFGKILMLITGIILLCWGIADVTIAIIHLASFDWVNVSSDIIGLVSLILSVVATAFFIVAGVTAIFSFFIATPTRIRKLNVYANLLFVVSLVIFVINCVFLVIDIVANKISVFAICELSLNLILPIVFLVGARSLRKSIR
ncbi:MAG: hypothetical protein WC366_02255 [Bacilli bacterium]|jgi:hypothetical protein